MKRYILPFLVLFAFGLLMSCAQKKKTNWHVNLNRNSKDPYGCYIAYHHLQDVFPEAKIAAGHSLMKQIKKVNTSKNLVTQKGNIIFVVCRNFEVDSSELEQITQFIKLGNGLCIFSENYSEPILSYFNAKNNRVSIGTPALFGGQTDTITEQKQSIIFNGKRYAYFFHGLSIQHNFQPSGKVNSDAIAIGYSDETQDASMLAIQPEGGLWIINRNPICMTNYFLLQESNRMYYEQLMSCFTKYPSSITWYSMIERKSDEKEESDFGFLWHSPPLLYAFLLLIALLLFYTVFESKRRQKFIPIIPPLHNSSLDFTETVGLLYFNKSDHSNLAEKMITYYLENIRSKYGIKTKQLDEEFEKALAQKTNHTATDIHAFISYLNYIRAATKLSTTDISLLYKQLKKYM